MKAIVLIICAATTLAVPVRSAPDETAGYRSHVSGRDSGGKEFSCDIPSDWTVVADGNHPEVKARTRDSVPTPPYSGIQRSDTGKDVPGRASITMPPPPLPDILEVESSDAAKGLPARITISIYGDMSRRSLEKEISLRRGKAESLPGFPGVPARVGALLSGWTYSGTSGGYIVTPLSSPEPASPPIQRTDTFVYFSSPTGSSFLIEYTAPIRLYAKHRGDFERLLKTFRWLKPAKRAPGK